MRKKLFLLLFLIIIFVGFILVRFFLLDNRNQYGELKILSNPPSTIFINNVAVSRTPFHERYPVGDYIIKLIPEGIATNTASWQGKINVYKNVLTFVNRELGPSDAETAGEILTMTPAERGTKKGFGELYVETEPQGALVYLNNEEKGTAPLIIENLPPGDKEISVFLPGYYRRTQKINIDAGYRVNAIFKLAIDRNSKKIIEETKEKEKIATKEGEQEQSNEIKVVVKDTPTGWLRVREEPSINATEAARVKPGDEFLVLDETENWVKIEYESGKFGWISKEYTTKK